MAEWKPKSFQPSTFKEDVSGVESFARGAYQGAGMGFADEQAGALDAIGGHLKRTFTNDWKRTGGGWWDDIKAEAEQVANDYRRGRDESRQAYSEAAEANPTAYGAGQFGGAVATGLLTGGASALGRAGLKGALTAGALEGAAGGLGGSNADLTHADLDAYAKAFRDSTEGGITGAGLAGGIYGVGKGLKWLGGKAVNGLRRARGELAEGVAAEREAADEVARAAEDKAAGRLAKDEYNARQMNARMDERAAREEAKRVAREAREAARAERPVRSTEAPELLEEPGTRTLNNYVGGAWSSRELNVERVAAARARLADPNIPAGQRAADLAYIERHAQAVDAPHEFVRGKMRAGLRRDQYPSDMVDRIMAERIDPQGNVNPRGAPEPVTQASDLGDAFRQGRGPEVARQGGGGSAFGQDYPADARTVSDVVPEGWDASAPRSGDPFHDAPTQAGLIRTSPPGGTKNLMGQQVHEFVLRNQKNGADIDVKIKQHPSDPDAIELAYIGPSNISSVTAMEDGYGSVKNLLGPGAIKAVSKDLAKEFPEAKRLTAYRATGANPDRELSIPLPEVTQVQPRGAIRGATPPGDFERTIAARNAENLPASGRRAAREWETLEQTEVNGMPAIPRGMRRLYRGEARGGNAWPEAPYPAGSLNAEDIKNADGRWFTDRAGVAHEYARRAAEISEGTPIAKYLDVPQGEARTYRMDDMPEGRFSDEAFREWMPPREVARNADIMSTPKDVPLGLEDGTNANVPFWNRGIGEDVWPQKVMDEVSPEDVTQRINLGDLTQRANISDLRQIIAKSENPALLRQRGRGLGSRNMGAAAYGDETLAYSNRDILRAQDAIGDVTQSGREPPVSGDDLRQWLDLPQETRGGAPEGLPLLEDITQPGQPSFPSDVRRAQPFQAMPQLRPEYQPRPPAPSPVFDEALAQRRAMGANAQAGAGGMPTRNLRATTPPPPAYDPNNSMASPRDFDAETVVPLGDTQVPRSARPAPYDGPEAPELLPEPIRVNPLRQARPRPLAPPVAPPSQTVMGAPPGSLVRQARPSVEDLAMQREQSALGDVARAGWEGARSANNALAAPFGAAYGIGKEALQNPAVRARAISLFRLDRLARVRPEVWARVGPTLQRAFQSGPERFKAERHILLLRDPEFRAAEAEADAELERMDGQPPTRRAANY